MQRRNPSNVCHRTSNRWIRCCGISRRVSMILDRLELSRCTSYWRICATPKKTKIIKTWCSNWSNCCRYICHCLMSTFTMITSSGTWRWKILSIKDCTGMLRSRRWEIITEQLAAFWDEKIRHETKKFFLWVFFFYAQKYYIDFFKWMFISFFYYINIFFYYRICMSLFSKVSHPTLFPRTYFDWSFMDLVRLPNPVNTIWPQQESRIHFRWSSSAWFRFILGNKYLIIYLFSPSELDHFRKSHALIISHFSFPFFLVREMRKLISRTNIYKFHLGSNK